VKITPAKITWRTRTADQRNALRLRRRARRNRKKRNEMALWEERKQRAARSAEDLLAYEFDRARKLIKQTKDPEVRDQRARDLAERIAAFNATCEVHTRAPGCPRAGRIGD
jgi:hypothetical protein